MMKRHTWAKRHCKWNGVFYESITAAARALGVSVHTMRYRLAKGWTCNEDIERGAMGSLSVRSQAARTQARRLVGC